MTGSLHKACSCQVHGRDGRSHWRKVQPLQRIASEKLTQQRSWRAVWNGLPDAQTKAPVGVEPHMRTNGGHSAEDLPDVELVQDGRLSRRVQPQHHDLCRKQAPSVLPSSMLQCPCCPTALQHPRSDSTAGTKPRRPDSMQQVLFLSPITTESRIQGDGTGAWRASYLGNQPWLPELRGYIMPACRTARTRMSLEPHRSNSFRNAFPIAGAGQLPAQQHRELESSAVPIDPLLDQARNLAVIKLQIPTLLQLSEPDFTCC